MGIGNAISGFIKDASPVLQVLRDMDPYQHQLAIRQQQFNRHMALAERQQRMHEEALDFANRVQTAKMNYDLMRDPAMKTVEGGTYEGTMTTPGPPTDAMKSIQQMQSGGPAAVDTPQVTTPTRAPVRPGATMDWGGKTYTALSPDELMAQQLRLSREAITSDALAKAGAAEAVRGRFGIPPPGEIAGLYPAGYKLTPPEVAKDVPVVMANQREIDRQRTIDARMDRQREDQQAFQAEQRDLDRKSREDIARENRQSREDIAKLIRATQASTKSDADRDKAVKDYTALGEKAQKQQNIIAQMEQGLQTPDPQKRAWYDPRKDVESTYVEPDNKEQYVMTPERRNNLKLRLSAAKGMLERMKKARNDIRKAHGFSGDEFDDAPANDVASANPNTPAPAPAPAAQPAKAAAPAVTHKKGETRQYQGSNYVFDGTQWVKQGA